MNRRPLLSVCRSWEDGGLQHLGKPQGGEVTKCVSMSPEGVASHSGCVGNVHTATAGDLRIHAAQNVLYSVCNTWHCT